MRADILTLFPGMFGGVLGESILGRAQAAGLLEVHTHNIRDYAQNKHHQADDYPFGGGQGMVMLAQPAVDCIHAVMAQSPQAKSIYLSPKGRVLTTAYAQELACLPALLLFCGHYEGVDQRIVDSCIDEEISIGDYVLTGGELPAMVLLDAVSRFIPGVLGCAHSAQEESHSDGLLEYPQYTRPAMFREQAVPEVLLGGHHANIQKWRRQQSLALTAARRPDMLQKAQLSPADLAFLEQLQGRE